MSYQSYSVQKSVIIDLGDIGLHTVMVHYRSDELGNLQVLSIIINIVPNVQVDILSQINPFVLEDIKQELIL